MSRVVGTWGRLAGCALTLAILVWRLGTGPFLAGVRAVDARALAAATGIVVLTTVCSAWRWKIVARVSASSYRCPLRWRRTTGRCSSTSRFPAGSSATSIAGSATVAACAMSAARCGPSRGSVPPVRPFRSL